MHKYFSAFLVLVLFGQTISQLTKDDLILTAGENRVWNIDQFSNKFSVSFRIEGGPKWITIAEKNRTISEIKTGVSGIIQSTKVNTLNDGSWKDTLAILNNARQVYYGKIVKGVTPTALTTITVGSTNDKAYDLEILSQDKLIVDGVQIQNDQQKHGFFVVNVGATPVTSDFVETPNYPRVISGLNFDRRITNIVIGETQYVLRYRRDSSIQGTDDKEDGFVEIFRVQPNNVFERFGVIDKQVLKIQKLSIEDVQVSDGLIYIIASTYGLFRVQLTDKIEVKSSFEIRGKPQRLSVASEDLQGERVVTVFVGGPNNIWELDWTSSTPVIRREYDIGTVGDHIIKSLDFSSQYLLVHLDKVLRIYRRGQTQLESLFYQFTLDRDYQDNVGYTLDQFTEKIILVSSSKVTTCQIGVSQLIANVPVDAQPGEFKFNLIVIPDGQVQEQTQFTGQIYKQDDNSIKVTTSSIKGLITPGGQYSANLDDFVSGSLIKYQGYKSTDDSLKVETNNEVQYDIDGINIEGTVKVHQFVRQPKNTNYKYKEYIWIAQNDKYRVYFYSCGVVDSKLKCNQEKEFEQTAQLTSIAFGSTSFYFLENQLSLIYAIDYKTLTKSRFTEPQSKDICIDLDILVNRLNKEYVVCTQQVASQITLFNKDNSEDSILIDSTQLDIQEFKPQQVQPHPNRFNTLFVQSNEQTIRIIDVGESGNIGPRQISYITSDLIRELRGNYQFFVGQNNLIIVSSNIIYEWDITDIRNPTYTKEYPKFTQTCQYSIDKYTHSFSLNTNTFYIPCTDSTKQRSQVLVYKLGAAYRDTLYKQIGNSDSDNLFSYALAVNNGESNQDYVLGISQQNTKFYQALATSTFKIQQTKNDLSSQVYEVQLTLNTFESNAEVNVPINIALLNENLKIVPIKENSIEIQVDTAKEFPQTNDIKQNEIINGPIFNFQLTNCADGECDGDKPKISLRQIVNKEKGLIDLGEEKQQLNSLISTENRVFALYNQDLYEYDPLNSEEILSVTSLKSELETNDRCLDISVDEQATYAFVLCQSGSQWKGVIISLLSQPTILFASQIHELVSSSTIKVRGELIFINDNISNTIRVFRIDLTPTSESSSRIQQINVIDQPSLGINNKLRNFDIRLNQKTYFIFIAVEEVGLRFVQAVYNDNKFTIQQSQNLDLSIQFPQQFSSYGQIKFNGVKIHSLNQNIDKKQIQTQVLVATENFNQYDLDITLSTSTTSKTSPVIDIIANYQLYPKLRYDSSIKVTEDYVIIPAIQAISPQEINKYIVVYQRVKKPNQQKNADSNYQNVSISGVILLSQTTDRVAYGLNYKSNKFWIGNTQPYSQSKQTIDEFQIYQNPALIATSKNIKTQNLEIVAKNPESTFNQKVTVKLINPTPPKPKQSVKWWIIALIIVGVILIGGLIYYLSKSKRDKEGSFATPHSEPLIKEP